MMEKRFIVFINMYLVKMQIQVKILSKTWVKKLSFWIVETLKLVLQTSLTDLYMMGTFLLRLCKNFLNDEKLLLSLRQL